MAYILIVDDDFDSVEVLCKYLERCGHSIQCAMNGQEALSHILHQVPDLVILDVVMPKLDGCGLLEILRSYLRLQTLPVIVLTGQADGSLLEKAGRFKANAIMRKGETTPQEIAEAVKLALPSKSL